MINVRFNVMGQRICSNEKDDCQEVLPGYLLDNRDYICRRCRFSGFKLTEKKTLNIDDPDFDAKLLVWHSKNK